MKIPPGMHCPLLDKKCIMQKCMFWTKLHGMHPQTGELVDEYDCSIKWVPILLIENAQKMREAGAAVESFRNEVVNMSNLARMERAGLPPQTVEVETIEDQTIKDNGPGGDDL